MNLVNLTNKEFDVFARSHQLKSFVQTSQMGEIRKAKNWQVYYLGFKKNDTIIGASMLLGKKEFYAPRGFLIDYNDQQLVNDFTNEIKSFVLNHNGFVLRIDPYLVYKQRNINGDIIAGIDNTTVVNTLKKIGFTKCSNDEQLKWLYVLELENKTEDDIFKEMCSNTRNIIRKTLKSNIKLRYLKKDDLYLFEKITNETGSRRGFNSKNLDYYTQMKDLFKDEVLFVVAELNLTCYISGLNNELLLQKKRLDKLSDVKANNGKKSELNITITSLLKKIDNANAIKETDGETIILSGAMFMAYGDELVYLFCGNYKKYINFGAQYFIQWEMIKYAIKNNFKRYNFYGISGVFDKRDESYGIYEFKKGFGGHVEELLGDYELGFGNHYKLYNFLKKVKK
ncbi:MAG: peptidoglycan bridge formation glycyltransferase FemA/FemB family protein [Bacilli bacterium]